MALALLVLCLAAAAASAARVQDAHVLAVATGKDKGQRAHVAFLYSVPTDKREAFVDAWRKLEGATKKEKGVELFDLKRPINANHEYVGYGEWKDMESYLEHFEADHTQAFLEDAAKLDVAWRIELLTRPDVAELRREPKRGHERDQAHVIIHYHVHPSRVAAFLDAWDKAEKGTEGEEGAQIYSLRRAAATNTKFIAYGTWDDMKRYGEHFKSEHVKQLLATLDKHNVEWHLAPLVKIGSQPE